MNDTHDAQDGDAAAPNITCLEDLPQAFRTGERQKFSNKWYRPLAMGPFAVVLVVGFLILRSPDNPFVIGAAVVALLWAGVVLGYALFLLVFFECPACSHRFGLGDTCRSCGFPRYRSGSDHSPTEDLANDPKSW